MIRKGALLHNESLIQLFKDPYFLDHRLDDVVLNIDELVPSLFELSFNVSQLFRETGFIEFAAFIKRVL